MLLYSTLLQIKDNMTKEDFIKLVIEWNQSNPREENIIKGICWNGEKDIHFGDEKLWLEIIEYRNKNIIAVRYEKVAEDGAIWDTDYIMNFDEMRLAIRLDRSYLEKAVITGAQFSTPHFITLLIQKGYLCPDNGLEILREAHEITEDNVSLIADVTKGRIEHQLPVVYVSKTFDNSDPVNLEKMCKRLKGAAHILVQKDRQSNDGFLDACGDSLEINGTIGIYFPNDSLGHNVFPYRFRRESGQLLDIVVNNVLKYGVLQRIDNLYTWQGVNNSLLKDRFSSKKTELQEAEDARKQAKNEVDKVYEVFEDDISSREQKIEQLISDNKKLENDNKALWARLEKKDDIPVIVQGNEEELYVGEIKEIILELVADALPKLDPKSRKEHVLRDVLNSNQYEKLLAQKRERVKKLLKTYSGMSESLKHDLEALGLTITGEGKHYKITLADDPRYLVTIPKTPGDSARGGANAVSLINKIMF